MFFVFQVVFLHFLLHPPLSSFAPSVDEQQCAVNPNHPACRGNGHQQFINTATHCHYQDLWLIPGKADSSCTRPNPRKLVELNARQVKITPPVVKLPGCFTVEIRNVHILENDLPEQDRSIFAKIEYQWLNTDGSMDANCQNSSVNGCGGFGNNCYYCDICESLRIIDERPDQSGLPSGVAEQFARMKCPNKAGVYTFRKEFCFTDWGIFDSNKDCRLDFMDSLSSNNDDQTGPKSALDALQQVGYGTIVAKVRLAFNATTEVGKKKIRKETQIERETETELEQRKSNWDPRKGNFDDFSHWLIAQRKGKWHRDEYLPWLLYENEIACVRLAFDVCQRPPQQRRDGSNGFTCI